MKNVIKSFSTTPDQPLHSTIHTFLMLSETKTSLIGIAKKTSLGNSSLQLLDESLSWCERLESIRAQSASSKSFFPNQLRLLRIIMIVSVWLLASVLTLSSVASLQYGNYETYDGGMSHNHNFNGYPNNPYMNPTLNPMNYNNNPYYSTNNRQTSNNILNSCEDYWSVLSDYNEIYGVLTIPSPDFRTIVIRVVLSLAAQLQTVSVN